MKIDKTQHDKKPRGDHRLADRRKYHLGRAEGERSVGEWRVRERHAGTVLADDILRGPGDVGASR